MNYFGRSVGLSLTWSHLLTVRQFGNGATRVVARNLVGQPHEKWQLTFHCGFRKQCSRYFSRENSVERNILEQEFRDNQMMPLANDDNHTGYHDEFDKDENNSPGMQSKSNALIFKEIADGNPEIEKQLKVLEFDIAVWRERFVNVPTRITHKQWLTLLELDSTYRKIKYLEFLFRNEKLRENEKARNQQRAMYRLLNWKKTCENHHMEYGLGKNAMYLRIYNTSLIQLTRLRLLTASLYSNHIVLDCSYSCFMSEMNQKFCAKQISFAYSFNRVHPAPFHFKLCNYNSEDLMSKQLHSILSMTGDSTRLDVTADSYLDLYPRDKLVYLTPHTRNVMTSYDPNKVYIIGAYVDRGQGQKISLGKAKEDNIYMERLPLDEYVHWKQGGKSLPVNTVISILLDVRFHQDWKRSLLQNIASRKIVD